MRWIFQKFVFSYVGGVCRVYFVVSFLYYLYESLDDENLGYNVVIYRIILYGIFFFKDF